MTALDTLYNDINRNQKRILRTLPYNIQIPVYDVRHWIDRDGSIKSVQFFRYLT